MSASKRLGKAAVGVFGLVILISRSFFSLIIWSRYFTISANRCCSESIMWLWLLCALLRIRRAMSKPCIPFFAPPQACNEGLCANLASVHTARILLQTKLFPPTFIDWKVKRCAAIPAGALNCILWWLGIDACFDVRCSATERALKDCSGFVVYIDFFSCIHYLIGCKVHLLARSRRPTPRRATGVEPVRSDRTLVAKQTHPWGRLFYALWS